MSHSGGIRYYHLVNLALFHLALGAKLHFVPDIPHRLSSDDVYGGYFIPKGSLVVANTWFVPFTEADAGPLTLHILGLFYTTKRHIPTHWSLSLTDFSKMVPGTLLYEIPLLQPLDLGGGYVPEGSWQRIPCGSRSPPSYLVSRSKKLSEKTEKSLSQRRSMLRGS